MKLNLLFLEPQGRLGCRSRLGDRSISQWLFRKQEIVGSYCEPSLWMVMSQLPSPSEKPGKYGLGKLHRWNFFSICLFFLVFRQLRGGWQFDYNCIGYFFCCFDKILDRSNLRKKGFILAHSLRVQSFMTGKTGGRCSRQLLILHLLPEAEECGF